MKGIQTYIYKPTNAAYCAYQVSFGGRSERFRQCGNKGNVSVEGFPFCTMHANEVRRDLGISDEPERYVYYVAISRWTVGIVRLSVMSETEKVYTVTDAGAEVGESAFYQHRVRKNDPNLFDRLADARKQLLHLLEKEIGYLNTESALLTKKINEFQLEGTDESK